MDSDREIYTNIPVFMRISFTVNMTSGGCTLSELCEYSNCDQLKNLLPSEVAGITMEIDDCEASCCTDDLCNDVAISEPEIPSITTDEPDISGENQFHQSFLHIFFSNFLMLFCRTTEVL